MDRKAELRGKRTDLGTLIAALGRSGVQEFLILRETAMTLDQVRLVRSASDVLLSTDLHVADRFYARLFALAPETRPLFQGDLTEQKIKLTNMLATLIGAIDHPSIFDSILSQLGRRHATYGVRSEHYSLLAPVFLASLEDVLGPRFTEEMREAWGTLYARVKEQMMQAVNA